MSPQQLAPSRSGTRHLVRHFILFLFNFTLLTLLCTFIHSARTIFPLFRVTLTFRFALLRALPHFPGSGDSIVLSLRLLLPFSTTK